MEAFAIEYEFSSKVYAPGQLVRGFLHLLLREPMKARAITLHAMGVAHTNWVCYETHPIPGRGGRGRGGGQGGHTSQRRVRGCHVYMDTKFVVWDGGNDKVLPAGLNNLPFSFNLPPVCPPSFEGSLGYIRYYCKAKIDRPSQIDKTAMLAFTVIPHFDLNTIPYAASPIMKSESMNFGIVLFKHGRILVKVALPKSGYVSGETICTKIEINNTSSKEVERVEMFLMEVSNFEGKCSEVRRTQSGHLDHVAKAHKHRVVTKATQKISMLANKTCQYSMRLRIPPIVPSFNICRIIHVDYKLEIKVLVTDVNSSLCMDIPVLIGTYPVQTSLLAHMPTNMPPVPEYLTPPQPTALPANINGPPPSYAECVFGRGTVALEDEDSANVGNAGFTPRYIYYNNTAQTPNTHS